MTSKIKILPFILLDAKYSILKINLEFVRKDNLENEQVLC